MGSSIISNIFGQALERIDFFFIIGVCSISYIFFYGLTAVVLFFLWNLFGERVDIEVIERISEEKYETVKRYGEWEIVSTFKTYPVYRILSGSHRGHVGKSNYRYADILFSYYQFDGDKVKGLYWPKFGRLEGRKKLRLELLVRGLIKIGLAVSAMVYICLLYTSPSPRDKRQSRMPSSA